VPTNRWFWKGFASHPAFPAMSLPRSCHPIRDERQVGSVQFRARSGNCEAAVAADGLESEALGLLPPRPPHGKRKLSVSFSG
jgi:hypothetical protein